MTNHDEMLLAEMGAIQDASNIHSVGGACGNYLWLCKRGSSLVERCETAMRVFISRWKKGTPGAVKALNATMCELTSLELKKET